jgi:UDP:flavonoid glycosyltransferase YjiC (YdhE family)
VLATLGLGLPQLCLPQGADQFINAAAVAGSGAGISLPPGQVEVGAVRDAVGRLVDDRSFGTAARRVSRSIESMPSPGEVVEVLEGLA